MMKQSRYIADVPVFALRDYKSAYLWCDQVILAMDTLDLSVEEYRTQLMSLWEAMKALGMDYAEGSIDILYRHRVHPVSRNRHETIIALPPNEWMILDHGNLGESHEYGVSFLNIAKKELGDYIHKLDEFDVYGGCSEIGGFENVNITLSDIDIIDPNSISWEAILELREDDESTKQLNKLRRFVVSDMQGYSLSHIEDELYEAIEEHQNAAKKWGISLGPGELTMNASMYVTFGIGSAIASIMTGSDLFAGAAIGAILPLGDSLVKINQSRKNVLKDSRVNYLINLINMK